ncbi:uncharacterized protein PG986_012437 [Apiospora aurea]|uniref:Uncharacterized protein n=1 Tax=Apiospora aurea TaxID=335848 RepID=A0ABR1PZZ7_9PEZI
MLRTRFPAAHQFTVSLFGCQYHAPSLDAPKRTLIQKFDELVKHGAIHVEELEPNDLPRQRRLLEGDVTQDTPDDKFSSPLPALPEPKPLSDKIRPGRTRFTKFPGNICFMVEGRDESAMPLRQRTHWYKEFDGLAKQWITNVMTAGAAKGLVSGRACHAFAGGKQPGSSSFFDGKGMIDSTTATSTIPETVTNSGILVDRIGPTLVPFLYIGSVGLVLALSVTSLRTQYWQPIMIARALLIMVSVSLAFYPLMPRWWGNNTPTTTNGQSKGVSDSGPSTATNSVANRPSSSALFPGLDYPQQTLLLFWLDLSDIEHLARYDKVHVKLHRNFLAAYGPGGDILLWVDMGILKGDEMDAEYVGCYEGTGFMAYDHDAAFESRRDVVWAGLPVFFDEPRESKPMEW